MRGQNICMDMLEGGSKGKIYEGWVSAYTIEAVLINLQSYLFVGMGEEDYIYKSKDLNQQIKAANDYQCDICKHRGPLAAKPPFQSILDNPALKNPSNDEKAAL